MKKVKLLVDTAYQGPRKEGDVLSVPDDFANRWAKNGIAEIYDGKVDEDTNEEVSTEEVSNEPEASDEVSDTNEVDYSSMSAKDLYAACKDKGIEVEAKKSKEYYIEKLIAHV